MRCFIMFMTKLNQIVQGRLKKYVDGSEGDGYDDDDDYNYNYHDYHFWLLPIKSVMLIKTALTQT